MRECAGKVSGRAVTRQRQKQTPGAARFVSIWTRAAPKELRARQGSPSPACAALTRPLNVRPPFRIINIVSGAGGVPAAFRRRQSGATLRQARSLSAWAPVARAADLQLAPSAKWVRAAPAPGIRARAPPAGTNFRPPLARRANRLELAGAGLVRPEISRCAGRNNGAQIRLAHQASAAQFDGSLKRNLACACPNKGPAPA